MSQDANTQKYVGASVIPVSQSMVDDAAYFGAFLDAAMDSMMVDLMWHSLGSRNPWPQAGFDFRENSDRNRYPVEPEYCECCGQRVDDCDE